jgi:hypothetical protein
MTDPIDQKVKDIFSSRVEPSSKKTDSESNSQSQRPPTFFTISTCFSISAILLVIWTITCHEGPSGMAGMFSGLLPLLISFALVGVGLILNIIGFLRNESLGIITSINLAFTIFAVVIIFKIL